MAKRSNVSGRCRICGVKTLLTEEHIIPKAAGGGKKIKMYNAEELLKVFDPKSNARGKIQQNGHTDYTLCRACNSHSGKYYDVAFADFYNTININLANSLVIPSGEDIDNFLEGKMLEVVLKKIKPLNIIKRILVSFCSIQHENFTEENPEIRKALMEKDYAPLTNRFSIYLGLHSGNDAFYPTTAALLNINNRTFIEAYAGIESQFLAFYLTEKDEHLKGGNMTKCIDITSWLTKYKYDQDASVSLELMFNKSFNVRFPLPKF